MSKFIVHIYDIKETGGHRTFKTPHHYIAKDGYGFGGMTIFMDRTKTFKTLKDAEDAAAYYLKYPTCYEVSIAKI